jgi:hypothetical protein
MPARLLALCAACCAALAVASLALPATPVYDAWAWLVWGRELAGAGLDLSSGPSWKPLPVGIDAVFALAGDAAPALWLVLVRAGWLLALVLAADLAYRLTADRDRVERIAAAAFAALSLLLLVDPFTAWVRQGTGGMSEPLLVALVLAAMRAALGERHRLALALGVLAALLRPETWPLLGLYGIWLWRRDRTLRPYLAAAAVAIPALWLLPDLVTAGDPFTGAERAQRADGSSPQTVWDVVQRAALLPLAAAWPLAALAVARRALVPRVLAAGALAWIATVALMTVAGFWGLPRFMAPAAAVLGILGGVGLARLLALVRARAGRPALAIAALVAVLISLAVQVPRRGDDVRDAAQASGRIGHSQDRLRALIRAGGGSRALLRCGRVATSDVLVRTALAWELDVPMSHVKSLRRASRLQGMIVVGPQAAPRLRRRIALRAPPRTVRGEWRLYSLPCAAPATATASAASTGVTGARR